MGGVWCLLLRGDRGSGIEPRLPGNLSSKSVRDSSGLHRHGNQIQALVCLQSDNSGLVGVRGARGTSWSSPVPSGSLQKSVIAPCSLSPRTPPTGTQRQRAPPTFHGDPLPCPSSLPFSSSPVLLELGFTLPRSKSLIVTPHTHTVYVWAEEAQPTPLLPFSSRRQSQGSASAAPLALCRWGGF